MVREGIRGSGLGLGKGVEPLEEFFGGSLAAEGGDALAVSEGVGHGDGSAGEVLVGEVGLFVGFDMCWDEGGVGEGLDDAGVVER